MNVGIVCAMYQEYLAVRGIVGSAVEQKDDVFTFTSGFIGDVHICLLHSGVGKICAALATQKLIKEYNIDMILIIGFSGSISNKISVGDIFLTNQVIDNSNYAECGVSFDIRKKVTSCPLATDKVVLKLFSDALQDVPEFTTGARAVLHKRFPSIVHGNLVTCDTLIYNDSTVKSEIRNEYDELCVDMESYGVYYVCSLYQLPCISIRLISDLCNQCAPLHIVRALARLTDYLGVLVSYIFDKVSFEQ